MNSGRFRFGLFEFDAKRELRRGHDNAIASRSRVTSNDADHLERLLTNGGFHLWKLHRFLQISPGAGDLLPLPPGCRPHSPQAERRRRSSPAFSARVSVLPSSQRRWPRPTNTAGVKSEAGLSNDLNDAKRWCDTGKRYRRKIAAEIPRSCVSSFGRDRSQWNSIRSSCESGALGGY